jgi:hypothetical protein
MAMEGIVRPFIPREVMPAAGQTILTEGTTQQNILLTIGKGGGGKTAQGSYTFNEQFYMTKVQKEASQ